MKLFNKFFYASLFLLAVVYCIGMQITIMDIDSSQYALISKEMFESGSYLQVFDKGANYLDKPPLLFWSACLSFKIFGIHDWAYRLPSVLCFALGVYSAYRYAKLFYGELTGKLAALIMAACCATYLMSLDVRTDTLLTGWVMFAMWQLAEFSLSLKLKNILLGAVGVGMAMLSKGPIGLIIPVTAFAVHFAYTRQWKAFLRWQYIVALLVIAIMLIPMSIGLYEQYDMHPGKLIDGQPISSGLRFYYWTQSFGRITGQSNWHNNPDPFFLFHSFLWSFLPWTVLLVVALFTEIKNKIKEYNSPNRSEAITVSGFVLILLFLSRSKYQLPHYTFVIHPLAAIITAKYIGNYLTDGVKNKTFSVAYAVHIFVMVVLYAASFAVIDFVFKVSLVYSALVASSLLLFIMVLTSKKLEQKSKVLLGSIIPFLTLTFVLNLNFYPNLLSYQSGSAAALDFNKLAPDNSNLLVFKDYGVNTMHFYAKAPVTEYIDEGTLPAHLVKGHTFIFADSIYTQSVLRVNPGIHIVRRYGDWAVTLLKGKFLNPSTRPAILDKKVLLEY